MYRRGDFDTSEPDVDVVRILFKSLVVCLLLALPIAIGQNEDELWRPYPHDALGPQFTPVPAHVMSCFREQCKLCELALICSPC